MLVLNNHKFCRSLKPDPSSVAGPALMGVGTSSGTVCFWILRLGLHSASQEKNKSIICNKGKYDTRLMLQRYLFSLRPVWNHQEIQNYCNVQKILPYFCRFEYNSLHYIHYICFPIPWWLSWQQYQGISWHLSNVQHFPESYRGPGTAVTWQWVPPCNCAHKRRKSPFSL